MSLITVQSPPWYDEVPRRTRVPTIAGFAAIAVFILGFGYWANTALIAGAVIASGAFVTTGENKIVQHLEGGVIRNILVHEGDTVERGQILMELDDTGPKAELARLVFRRLRDEAIEARLLAEIHDDKDIRFPDSLLERWADPDIISIVSAQQLTFDAWRKDLDSESAALLDSVNAYKERVSAAQSEKTAVEKQLDLIREELQGKKELLPKGLIRKSEILALQRAEANLQGDSGKYAGEIGDATDQIAKTEQQILGLRTAATKEAVEQLHQTRADIADLRERIRSQKDILQRVHIEAPVSGVVVKMRYHTPGGVVEPGRSILEIVPTEGSLLIEVRVRPQDIDHVKVGAEAAVRLSALNRRTTPTLTGHVIYVSADVLPDDAQAIQGKEVYVVRIALDGEEPASMKGFHAKPGMPAEVYIKTSERTFFRYLIQPVLDSMSRAFRET